MLQLDVQGHTTVHGATKAHLAFVKRQLKATSAGQVHEDGGTAAAVQRAAGDRGATSDVEGEGSAGGRGIDEQGQGLVLVRKHFLDLGRGSAERKIDQDGPLLPLPSLLLTWLAALLSAGSEPSPGSTRLDSRHHARTSPAFPEPPAPRCLSW